MTDERLASYTGSMNKNGTPEWIKRLDLSRQIDTQSTFPTIIDHDILRGLEKLSPEELDELADISGVREHQGVLVPSHAWSREQYIEILSNTGEMLAPQVERIKKYLQTPR